MIPSIACPHCGKQYQVSDEYLAANTGKSTECTACQSIFTIALYDPGVRVGPPPLPLTEPMEIRCSTCGMAFGVTPEYLVQYGGQQTHCTQCNGAIFIPSSVSSGGGDAGSLLNYSTPHLLAKSSSGAYRQGNLLVVLTGRTLPARCLRCNAPTNDSPKRQTFYWHSPARYLLILVGVLLYIIVAMCVRNSATVSIYYCAKHRARLRNAKIIGWVGALGGLVAIVAGGLGGRGTNAAALLIGGVACFFGSIIWAAVVLSTIAPKRIDAGWLYLKGASNEYLDTLPST